MGIDPQDAPAPAASGEVPNGHAAIVMSGFVTKQGGKVKSWKKRWASLDAAGTLKYFKSEKDIHPQGVVFVVGCIAKPLLHAKNGSVIGFQIVPPVSDDRTYFMRCESSQVSESWIRAIDDINKSAGTRASGQSLDTASGPLERSSTPVSIRSEDSASNPSLIDDSIAASPGLLARAPSSTSLRVRASSRDPSNISDAHAAAEQNTLASGSRPNSMSRTVIKSGYLKKQGRINPKWQPRWFDLDTRAILQYSKAESSARLGFVDVSRCFVWKDNSVSFGITLAHYTHRNYNLQANGPVEQEAWLTELTECSLARCSLELRPTMTDLLQTLQIQDEIGMSAATELNSSAELDAALALDNLRQQDFESPCLQQSSASPLILRISKSGYFSIEKRSLFAKPSRPPRFRRHVAFINAIMPTQASDYASDGVGISPPKASWSVCRVQLQQEPGNQPNSIDLQMPQILLEEAMLRVDRLTDAIIPHFASASDIISDASSQSTLQPHAAEETTLSLLQRLWAVTCTSEDAGASFPGRSNDVWKTLGWQAARPESDLRGAGLLGLRHIVFFAENYSDSFRGSARDENPYPVCAIGINVTALLLKKAGVYGSSSTDQSGDDETMPPPNSALLLALCILVKGDVEHPFEQIYSACMKRLDKIVTERCYGYMDMPRALQQVEDELDELLKVMPDNVDSLLQWADVESSESEGSLPFTGYSLANLAEEQLVGAIDLMLHEQAQGFQDNED